MSPVCAVCNVLSSVDSHATLLRSTGTFGASQPDVADVCARQRIAGNLAILFEAISDGVPSLNRSFF